MKNFIYRLQKLNDLNGLAEIREKECEECIRKGMDMEVLLILKDENKKPTGQKEKMIITLEELKAYELIKDDQSNRLKRWWMDPKYVPSGVGYWLWRFEWQPIEDKY